MTAVTESGSIASSIRDILENELSPTHFQLINDSSKHAAGINNPDAETHFTLLVVAAKFQGISLVARHQLIYKLLADEMGHRKEHGMERGVHALSLQLYTEDEWQHRVENKGGNIVDSPPCAHTTS
ncbi:MAG: BolA family transcriptional regulator [Gammaproteobacteria bacterium]|nr:BolA family transcriptional regulator [Gammaproteobacteria bacterium]